MQGICKEDNVDNSDKTHKKISVFAVKKEKGDVTRYEKENHTATVDIADMGGHVLLLSAAYQYPQQWMLDVFGSNGSCGIGYQFLDDCQNIVFQT